MGKRPRNVPNLKVLKKKKDLETGGKQNPKAEMVADAVAEKVAEVEGSGGGDEIKWVRTHLAYRQQD